MDDATLPPQTFAPPRHLPTHPFSYPPAHPNPSPVTPQSYSPHHLDPSLNQLDGGDGFHPSFAQHLEDPGPPQAYLTNPFRNQLQQQRPSQRLHDAHDALSSPGQPQTSPLVSSSGAQYGGLSTLFGSNPALERVQQQESVGGQDHNGGSPSKKEGSSHFPGMRMVQHPPNLDSWREKLFHVEEPITLTEEQFQTYFPHIDNVYSHRSTQRYKRKPFVSHYWDCRLKGRPPGTPKSDDPNKKKRKRQARERDLCDVKIKITEYFPGARATMAQQGDEPNDGTNDDQSMYGLGELGLASDGSPIPGSNGERYYTISRVNGSMTQGKVDTIAAVHKHTLEESDRIKKSSVHRQFLKDEKERKKVQKTYHKKATGAALQTAKKHAKEHELKLYGSCFCPFVQRVWISMEHKSLAYQYVEVDPYKKPQALLALNPLGLVPALQHDSFSCHESTVLLEYLEDAFTGSPLLPPDPRQRAFVRLWADHVNRKLIPTFYRTLQAQETPKQVSEAEELKKHLQTLVEAADPHGPFFMGAHLGWVDVQLAPWLLRFSRVLAPYRGWPEPDPMSRWGRWVAAVEAHQSVKSTTSTNELYKDSYERYAENRPGTSQVADAVNSGRGLP